jgi:flagellar biosynthetic protein FliQ
MTETYVLTLTQNALQLTLLLAAPLLLVSLLVGVLVSIFQAATQINEATLTFIPKVLGISLVLLFLGSWMGQKLLEFTTQVFTSIGNLPK